LGASKDARIYIRMVGNLPGRDVVGGRMEELCRVFFRQA
jgi:hypothetical protein